MKQCLKRLFARLMSVVLAITLMYTLCGNCFAISSSSTSFISDYSCDFEGNYTSVANSKLCTDSIIKTVGDKGVLEQLIKDNSEKAKFIIHNSNSGDLVLKDGNTYAVTIKYRIVQIAGDRDDRQATILNLARLDDNTGEMVKIKSFTNASYYPGDSTDWVTSTAIFKASMTDSENYNKLAVNVVSLTCPSKDTGVSVDRTIIQFDEISVSECNATTNGIEFISNGGEFCEPLMAQSGDAVTLPTPKRDLYEFKGWYSDIALTKNFTSSTMPSSQTTKLYAKWTPVDEATVIVFNSNGGESVEMLVGNPGDKVTLPATKRQDCHFSGWYDKSLKNRVDYTVFPDNDVTVYAKWDIIPYICNFENTDKFKEPNSAEMTLRTCLSEKQAYSGKTSLYYDFHQGTSTGVDGYARTMLIDYNGEKICVEAGVKYVVTFKYKVVEVEKPGRIGLVTSSPSGTWGVSAIQTPYSDVTNGGILYTADDVGKGWQTGKWEIIFNPARNNANALNIGFGGIGKFYIDDVVVYRAGQNSAYRGYIVGFDSQGGPLCETQYVKIGDTVTLPTLKREGYRFIGWSYDQKGTQQIESETITVESPYTLLYANWYKTSETSDVQTPTPDTTPESEPDVDDNQQSGAQKGNFFSENKVLIIVGSSALVLIVAVVVLIVVIVKKKKNKQEVKEETEE